ncbi:MAG TPA: hypothetical protein ENN51_06685 [candidate division WOR-3 bacterium]|uniref:TNase-like domain-containing protein n=1 Tax=candidate division WOR-3 bacterium TaxID=2052148 RepID=A0A7V0XFR0_UNCW3|nr:hypothetical protein [candidate division WOR-3 bacterium]
MLRIMACCCLLASALAADEAVEVVHVHDGDTFLTEDGRSVRLLGIDAAETYEAGGDVAGEMLEKYVLGRKVRLESDRSDTDHFGRLLRWVWVGDTNVNLLMARNGYAEVRLFQEGLKYEDTLRALGEEAARLGRGLWAFNVYTPPSIALIRERVKRDNPTDPGVIHWSEAADYMGKAAVVEGDIVRTYQSQRVLFLNFHEDYRNTFFAAIFTSELPRFPTDAKDYYLGKRVRITGIIKEYRGAPEIIVSVPEQIEVLGPATDTEN